MNSTAMVRNANKENLFSNATMSQVENAGVLLGLRNSAPPEEEEAQDRSKRRRMEAQKKKDARHEENQRHINFSTFDDRFYRQDRHFGQMPEPPEAFVIPGEVQPPSAVTPRVNPYKSDQQKKAAPKKVSAPSLSRPLPRITHNPSRLPGREAPPNSVAANVLALIEEKGYDGMDPSLVETVNNTTRGKNTAKVEKRKASEEARFFDTLRQFGGSFAEPLLQVKTGAKGTVGEPMQPVSLEKYLQNTYNVFHSKGIMFEFNNHFNGPGELRGVVSTIWNKQHKKDPSFGAQPNRRRIKEDFMGLMCDAIANGVLKITDSWDVLRVAMATNAYGSGFRGKMDHYNALLSHCRSGIFSKEEAGGSDLVGTPWRGMFVS
ncbi:hypothetical protein SEMRO_170_G075510.1 [Seminavis robusta]|uniref:Uncharacterized protein n=1 Tax=Seminavis robusta TaxID=568900 RepID=A0A9N8HB53_9STRA|nr:hypothetical protein SEMRO_170_G075510.1 [Seminavis robusta]|eukprot:Sro170_g075510.1 n/a (376) ;mRNA; r:68661-69932